MPSKALDPSRLSSSALFAHLRDVRASQRRCPEEVVAVGEQLVERGQLNRDKDQVWDAMEQIATAAVECGQISLASVLTAPLAVRFSNRAPRVAVLQVMLLERRGELRLAREFYKERLRHSKTDISASALSPCISPPPLLDLPTNVSSLSSAQAAYFDAALYPAKYASLPVRSLYHLAFTPDATRLALAFVVLFFQGFRSSGVYIATEPGVLSPQVVVRAEGTKREREPSLSFPPRLLTEK